MTDVSFDEWCRRLKESDRSAYEQVFREMYEPLVRYTCSITKSRASASDIVQDVFVRLWETRSSLDPSQSLEAYLYRSVRNRAYNLHRNRRTRSDKEDDVQSEPVGHLSKPPAPDDAVDARNLESHLETWISELPDRQREALELSRFQGLSHEDVAEVMEISPRTVNNHIVRALRSLRERIRTYEPSLLDA
ncbi:RNA polymerase subunit sigma-70 [Longibacter salinarum]|uniref:RNA polymerase subunit sigma-70 n=1 Tax=Longibacter salinarum TaxID=1850348 RepID=A0A2A8CTE4_9BACT|nr:RNA polymerase sigma-70 factor [Longibacter salinarum]PEN10953.1 RNA polymerase subunit sigma-70 [Longibacter salinarum]